MRPPPDRSCRILRYAVVGLMGLTVKFSVLISGHEILGLGYLLATALAVEAVVLHNFFWHLRWTWDDRSRGISQKEVLVRLLRFHLGNAAVAMVMNLVIMGMIIGHTRIHYVAANLIATAGAGIANFVIANSLVFVTARQRSHLSVRKYSVTIIGNGECSDSRERVPAI